MARTKKTKRAGKRRGRKAAKPRKSTKAKGKRRARKSTPKRKSTKRGAKRQTKPISDFEQRGYRRLREEGYTAKQAMEAVQGHREMSKRGWGFTWMDDYDEETGEKLNLVILQDDHGTELARGWEHSFSDIGQWGEAGGMAYHEAKRMDALPPAPRQANAKGRARKRNAKSGTREWYFRNVIVEPEDSERALQWHGSQGSALYSFGSTAMSHYVSPSMAQRAIDDLESTKSSIKAKAKKGEYSKKHAREDVKDLDSLIGELEKYTIFSSEFESEDDDGYDEYGMRIDEVSFGGDQGHEENRPLRKRGIKEHVACGDIPKKRCKQLQTVYKKQRKKGMSKTRSAKIARGAVRRTTAAQERKKGMSKQRTHQGNPPSGLRSYGPGKFYTKLDAALYELTLDGGADDEASYPEGGGWYGVMYGGDSIATDIRTRGLDVTAEELAYLQKNGRGGVILFERSDGIVEGETYATKQAIDRAWKEIQEEMMGFEENPMRQSNPRSSDDALARKLARGEC